MTRIEHLILNHLFLRDQYLRKVMPFLKDEYFQDKADRTIFQHVSAFVDEYNTLPSPEAIDLSIQADRDLGEKEYNEVMERLSTFNDESELDGEWLVAETEKFCKQQAIFNAVSKAVMIIDGKDKQLAPSAIPSLLEDALAVSFDTNIGHDYLEDAEARYEYYNKEEERIPFDLEILNKITRGGIPKKTLNVIMAPTGKGKSIFLCHHAASCLSQGKNVLYITLEMAEERIAERIDANLLDIELDVLHKTPKERFVGGIERLRKKAQGKLIIKEYPTGSAHVGHFRALLSELRLKKKFIPDVIIVDYLNLCTSSRVKMSANVNSYVLVKSVAEELRGLGVEVNAQVFSATQTNRGGYDNSDLELTDTSESMGLTHTCDFFLALSQDEDMESQNQCLMKQLKNRFGKPNYYRRFMMGLDKDKMRFYDLESRVNDEMQRKEEHLYSPTPSTADKFGRDFTGIVI